MDAVLAPPRGGLFPLLRVEMPALWFEDTELWPMIFDSSFSMFLSWDGALLIDVLLALLGPRERGALFLELLFVYFR